MGQGAPSAGFCHPSVHPVLTRRPRRSCCHLHPATVASARQSDNGGDDLEDVETDTVLSRRVFSAGIFATGLFTAIEGAQLFYGDEYKDKLLAPVKRAIPSWFPNEQELKPAPRAPMDMEFASLYYNEHARVAVAMELLSAAELKQEEDELLTRSRALFFTSTEAATRREEFNYRLYARVHTIATHTSPRQRLAFARTLGEAMYKRLAAMCELPDPKAARRDLRGTPAVDDLLAALQIVLAKLQAIGWITGSTIGELDSLMLAEEGRGELTVTCNDVLTLPTAMLLGEERFEEASPKVSGMLAALLASYGCSSISSEDYYLDSVYRPDASLYSPTLLVTQFDFTVPGPG